MSSGVLPTSTERERDFFYGDLSDGWGLPQPSDKFLAAAMASSVSWLFYRNELRSQCCSQEFMTKPYQKEKKCKWIGKNKASEIRYLLMLSTLSLTGYQASDALICHIVLVISGEQMLQKLTLVKYFNQVHFLVIFLFYIICAWVTEGFSVQKMITCWIAFLVVAMSFTRRRCKKIYTMWYLLC